MCQKSYLLGKRNSRVVVQGEEVGYNDSVHERIFTHPGVRAQESLLLLSNPPSHARVHNIISCGEMLEMYNCLGLRRHHCV